MNIVCENTCAIRLVIRKNIHVFITFQEIQIINVHLYSIEIKTRT